MNNRLKNMVDNLVNEYKDEELNKISILQSDRKTKQKEHCDICGKASESDTVRITYLYGTITDQHRKTILTVCDSCRMALCKELSEYETACKTYEQIHEGDREEFAQEIEKAYKESQKHPEGDGSFFIEAEISDDFTTSVIEEAGFEILERKNDVFIGEDELTGEKYYGPRYRIRKRA